MWSSREFLSRCGAERRLAPVLVLAALLATACDMTPRFRVEIRPVQEGQAPAEPLAAVNEAAREPPEAGREPPAAAGPEKLAPVPGTATRVPAPGGATAAVQDGAALLAARPLVVPVQGVAPSALRDNFTEARGARRHEAIDIMAPTGTPVVAVDDGRLAKLFTSKAGGLTVYHFDPEEQLAYYYAHLDAYAPGLREGMSVRRGQLIGYVGSTGNVGPDAPHLHFAVFRLGPHKLWWKGDPVNPYPALRRAQVAPEVAQVR
jgi:peptidoglycan LD-endopeptidase LytH